MKIFINSYMNYQKYHKNTIIYFIHIFDVNLVFLVQLSYKWFNKMNVF